MSMYFKIRESAAAGSNHALLCSQLKMARKGAQVIVLKDNIMPPSKKELRKISKALRRSECGSNISTRSSSFSLAKDNEGSITVSATASAKAQASKLTVHRGRQSGTVRSLSEASANFVMQSKPISSKTEQRVSDDAATAAPVASFRPLLGGQCPDPFLDTKGHPTSGEDGAVSKLDGSSDHSAALVEDDLDEAGISTTSPSDTRVKSITSRRQRHIPPYWHSQSAKTLVQPPNALVKRLLSIRDRPKLPISNPRSPEAVGELLLERQPISDGNQSSHTHLQAKPFNVPPASLEFQHGRSRAYLLESLGESRGQHSQSMLANDDSVDIDHALRTRRWIEQTPHNDSIEQPTLIPSESTTRPALEPTELPSLKISAAVDTNKAKTSNSIDTASGVQSQATTLLTSAGTRHALLSGMDRPLVGPLNFGGLSQSFKHPQGPPWGYHPRNQYPWFNSPAPYVSTLNTFGFDWKQGTTPGVFHNSSGPQRRQHDPITVPMSLQQRRGLSPSDPTHRYEPGFYETSLDACRRLKDPDWTQDARGRVEIPKPPQEDERT
ncbi:MAG: hypothetical protein Q9225_002167, partial [Loekoesia sp. 1 TL-2023]